MGQRRALSEEELALWRAVAGTARPLKRKRKGKVRAKAKPPEAKLSPPPKPISPKTSAPISATAKPAPRPPSSRPGVIAGIDKKPGIDKNLATRLRRGQLPIEGRIDLHGSTQAEAHDALRAFLIRASGAGKRCLLIITGKGRAKEGGTNAQNRGILKTNVPRWLHEPGLKPLILATHSAKPKHGGDGALYVLLKRKK